jgi:hypothetical protein
MMKTIVVLGATGKQVGSAGPVSDFQLTFEGMLRGQYISQ